MWKNTHTVAEQQFSATFADVSNGLLLCSIHVLLYHLVDLHVNGKSTTALDLFNALLKDISLSLISERLILHR